VNNRALTAVALVTMALVWTSPALSQAMTLQDFAKAADEVGARRGLVIYPAREIITLDPARPSARAVAVRGDRIVGVGSLDELKQAAGQESYAVDATFANQVIVPGFIAQHDHPLLAALTMTSEIIAIEDWVLPQGTSKAARNHEEYLQRLAEANARQADPDSVLLTWGYHHYFHGALKKSELDAVSATRPIIVWHRSAHEFYLNTAAEKKYGVDRAWFDKLSGSRISTMVTTGNRGGLPFSL